MNAIAGYKAVRLFFADQVQVAISSAAASVSSDCDGLVLPISDGKVSLRTDYKGDGSWLHSAEITLRESGVDAEKVKLLRQIPRRGAIIVAEDFSGRRWLFGDSDYPLDGFAVEEHGTAHTDLHCWKLDLSCVCMHPELIVP